MLLKHVVDRALLLVLDNCEHLADACAALARQVLQAGPRLKVLASSREPLRVTSETTYVVSPLGGPDPDRTYMPAELGRYEAVRVFVERATAARPAFQLTAQNAGAVREICLRLDGIPLALELAAARVRSLSVETIAARLADRFHLLTGGDRTVLPRQQTLRASIDWSYDLLNGPERALLRRLAVFGGTFTVEATESVAACDEVESADIVDLLAHLVDKSFVVMHADLERYRLLESVRQYAQMRLTEAGEDQTARERHLRFYLALGEAAEPNLLGPQQGAWLARLHLEQANLLAAHASCDRAGSGAALGLRLCFALRNYWLDQGLLHVGHRLALDALSRAGAEGRNLIRCRALAAAASLEYFMGLYPEAQEHLAESLSIAEAIGDRERILVALMLSGHIAVGDDPAAARGFYERSLQLARELGDIRRIASILNGLAIIYTAEDDLDRAEPLLQESLAIDRQRGDHDGVALGLAALADLSLRRGLAEQGRQLLLEAFDIVRAVGLKRAEVNVLFNCIPLAMLLADWGRAARLYGWTEARREATGFHREPTDDRQLAQWLRRMSDALGAPALRAAEAAGRAAGYAEFLADARAWLSRTPSTSLTNPQAADAAPR
jgi:predicted ATPase